MKKILILSLLALSIVLVGCTTCNSPYIEYKTGECCLDSNGNNICDNDENIVAEEPKIDIGNCYLEDGTC